MPLLITKISKLRFARTVRVLTLVPAILVCAFSAALAQTSQQVSFTATGTAVLTGTAKLPGGLTQLNATVSGNATHLGDFTGPLTRIQDNQGNFGTTTVLVGANGKDSIFLAVSGVFEGGSGNNKCLITSTGTYSVTGGAGAFANATGNGTITTQIDLCAGTATGTYTGTISQPNSN